MSLNTIIYLSSSTRGLDSSTALEFVRALRIATDTFRLTSVLCLYQAGESLYRHFDKVCVLYEGQMAYFGPADQARQYFIDMGQVSEPFRLCVRHLTSTKVRARQQTNDRRFLGRCDEPRRTHPPCWCYVIAQDGSGICGLLQEIRTRPCQQG